MNNLLRRFRPSNTRLTLAIVLALASPLNVQAAPPIHTGTINYQPAENEEVIPEQFRLAAHSFAFEQQALETVSTKILISEIRFPSPVQTPHPNNNTVHCEYFRPAATDKYPGVVVLHILGGDFDLSRVFCRTLAQHGVAALFVKLPYYGPREQPDVPVRMVSLDPHETVRGMTQAVLDIRRARAWLAAQEEINPEQLGIFGISLGGITSALAASAEPRFQNVCVMLAGGDLGQANWDASRLTESHNDWLAQGGTREEFVRVLRPIDPVTYAENVRGRNILMLNARYDEIIPEACTLSLWHVLGEPEILWYDGGHFSSMRFIFDALAKVTRFFQPREPD